jgi:hypothetical protein
VVEVVIQICQHAWLTRVFFDRMLTIANVCHVSNVYVELPLTLFICLEFFSTPRRINGISLIMIFFYNLSLMRVN